MSDMHEYREKLIHNANHEIPKFILLADEILLSYATNLDRNQHVTSARLFQMSFSSWRAATFLASAGAVGQVAVLARHSLESAIYAYVLSIRQELHDAWHNREFDSNSKKLLRHQKKGLLPTFRRELRQRNPEAFLLINDTLNFLIDFGAHPNVINLFEITSPKDEDNQDRYETKLIHGKIERDEKLLMLGNISRDLVVIFFEIWPIRIGAKGNLAKLDELNGQIKVYRKFLDTEKIKPQRG